jgi:hypothetical protein
VQNWGWPAVFEVYGSLGLLWIVAWQKLVTEKPPVPPGSTAAAAAAAVQPAAQLEQQQQQQQQQQLPSVASSLAPGSVQQQQQQQQVKSLSSLPNLKDIPWKSFFTNRPFLALLLTHSSFGERCILQLQKLFQQLLLVVFVLCSVQQRLLLQTIRSCVPAGYGNAVMPGNKKSHGPCNAAAAAAVAAAAAALSLDLSEHDAS